MKSLLPKRYQFLSQEGPSYMIFWVTGRCNARCAHCFNLDIIEDAHNRNQLTLEEIQQFSKKYGHLEYLTLAGGEPTLRHDLVEISKCFYEQNGLNHLTIVTNGYLPQKTETIIQSILEACPNLKLYLFVSLDGLEKKHDEIRKVPGGFKKSIDTILRLKKIQDPRFSLSVAAVYSAYNQEHIEGLYHYVKNDLRVPMTVNLVRGKVRDPAAKEVNFERYERLVKEIETDRIRGRKRHIIDAVNTLTTKIISRTVRENKMQLPCKAGEKSFILSDNGDVIPCELLDDVFGNIRDFE
jgi:MoaA/NifB/PqqE/SkfB family radical SAM enzyme